MIHALVIAAVLVVSAVLFCTWLFVTVIQFFWRLIAGSRPAIAAHPPGRPCMNPSCRMSNPVHAQFCRRCGTSLVATAAMPRQSPPQARYNPVNGRQAFRV